MIFKLERINFGKRWSRCEIDSSFSRKKESKTSSLYFWISMKRGSPRMSIHHSRFIVHFYTVVAPRVASCRWNTPRTCVFHLGALTRARRVHTPCRRKLSARATPRNSLVCPLVARWPRSIRMSIRITATERARNNFCSWDWSHCGWIVDPSFPSVGRVAHPRPLSRHFNLPLRSLQEKTKPALLLLRRPETISIDPTSPFSKPFSPFHSSLELARRRAMMSDRYFFFLFWIRFDEF